MACDTPKPCKFPSLDSCQRRFPWTHEEADSCFTPSRWSCAPGRRYREVSSRNCSQKQAGSMFHSHGEDRGETRRVELEPACKADGVAPPDPVKFSCCCRC